MSQPAPAETAALGQLPRPSYATILRVWLALGAQSFGGGAATLYLIRRAVVEQHRWISADEFNRDWAICQIAPGINLLGLTILIGRRTGGGPGVVLALLGLLLPSVSITIALTALYASVRGLDIVQAGLRGVVPATVGLGWLLAWQQGHPPLVQSRREGWPSLLVSCALILGAGIAVGLLHPPVIAILLGGGALGALAASFFHRKP